MDKTRVIVITGAPGVGKTETARGLIQLCPERSALLDSDAVGAVHPFRIDEEWYELVSLNLQGCLDQYARWKARVVILSGVFIPEGLYRVVRRLTSDTRLSWKIYSLVASERVLRKRILGDPKPQDALQRLEWLHLNDVVQRLPDATVIDTSAHNLTKVISTIARSEGFLAEQDSSLELTEEATVDVPLDVARKKIISVLVSHKTTPTTAEKVAHELLNSEAEGYSSHGLVRLPDYVREIAAGTLKPDRQPKTRQVSDVASIVDGQRSFGALANESLCVEIERLLSAHPVCVVGLVNSSHIGRLAHVAEPLARKGYMILGFANYLGAGQRVAPWGGAAARFCTNPIVFAGPGLNEDPLVVDLTTSVVSEGRVRMERIRGAQAKPGWLIDSYGRSVADPNRLYTDPPTAFLAPLGGDHGYKGYALGLVVEVLAGVITGAGCVRPNAATEGNGAFVIGLRTDILGQSADHIGQILQDLYSYCTIDCPLAEGVERILLPGQRARETARATHDRNVISVPLSVWERVLFLNDQAHEV